MGYGLELQLGFLARFAVVLIFLAVLRYTIPFFTIFSFFIVLGLAYVGIGGDWQSGVYILQAFDEVLYDGLIGASITLGFIVALALDGIRLFRIANGKQKVWD